MNISLNTTEGNQMTDQLAKKLLIKPGSRLLVRHAPAGYLEKLDPLPPGVELSTEFNGRYDVVLLFVANKAGVDREAMQCLTAAGESGILWLIYPKRTKNVHTDINRDTGWDVLWQAGWVGIAIAAVDEAWAALRFRQAKDVKRSPASSLR
jgi:hypothetical protein